MVQDILTIINEEKLQEKTIFATENLGKNLKDISADLLLVEEWTKLFATM